MQLQAIGGAGNPELAASSLRCCAQRPQRAVQAAAASPATPGSPETGSGLPADDRAASPAWKNSRAAPAACRRPAASPRSATTPGCREAARGAANPRGAARCSRRSASSWRYSSSQSRWPGASISAQRSLQARNVASAFGSGIVRLACPNSRELAAPAFAHLVGELGAEVAEEQERRARRAFLAHEQHRDRRREQQAMMPRRSACGPAPGGRGARRTRGCRLVVVLQEGDEGRRRQVRRSARRAARRRGSAEGSPW